MALSSLRIIAFVFAVLLWLATSPPAASTCPIPMLLNLCKRGPSDACTSDCKLFISASGAITAETPRHFLLFAQNHDLAGATFAIDSDGGSVLGAIALGREIRNLKFAQTVGRLVGVPGGNDEW